MANSAENISIANGTLPLSIDARQLPQSNDTISLNMSGLTRSQYTLQIFSNEMGGSIRQPWLQDNYMNTIQPLLLNDTNNVVFNVSAGIPSSFATNRFRILFQTSGAVLPVTFTSVKASIVNRDVRIDWEVAQEPGTVWYEIERSVNGTDFTKIGVVNATQNNDVERYYWVDVNAHPVINYYRVRSMNVDGKSGLSKIVFVNMTVGGSLVKVFPNPVKDKVLHIYSAEMQKGKYTLRLSNAQGQEIEYRVVDHPGGAFKQTIHFHKMPPPGIYYLQLANDTNKFSQPVFVE
jgi:hypothetical protein